MRFRQNFRLNRIKGTRIVGTLPYLAPETVRRAQLAVTQIGTPALSGFCFTKWRAARIPSAGVALPSPA